MLAILKKSKRDTRKLLYSPVYVEEIIGVMYQQGEILPHARMKILTETPKAFAGVAFKEDETLFFVASHPNVIAHIQKQGCVPLVQAQYLRFFKDKKRMNYHLARVAI